MSVAEQTQLVNYYNLRFYAFIADRQLTRGFRNGCRQRVGAAMFDINREIELLERCASECDLISGLATDQRARYDNEKLGSEYRHIAEELKSIRTKWNPQSEGGTLTA